MIQKIHLSFTYITTRDELFEEFSRVFVFPIYFGNNWDAFLDCMSSLTSETQLIQEVRCPLTGVHLVLHDFDILETTFPEGDLSLFRVLLIDLSASPEFRGDRLSFTFEIRYSPGFCR